MAVVADGCNICFLRWIHRDIRSKVKFSVISYALHVACIFNGGMIFRSRQVKSIH